MPTNRRIERINKTLMKEISEVIMLEVKDPRMISLISVLEVNMSSDFKYVRVTVSIYGQKEIENLKTLEALNSASGFISSMVSKNLRLRTAPTMKFERSDSIEKGIDMYFKLKELSKNDQPEE